MSDLPVAGFGLTQVQMEVIRTILGTMGPELEKVVVFGSRAQGKHRMNSDLDLVLYGNLDEKVSDRLWTLFQESPLPFSVDVKTYNAIRYTPLRRHIDTVGRTLFFRSPEGLVTTQG